MRPIKNDILNTIEKDFSNSMHQNFNRVQQSMVKLFHQVATASEKNDYQSLLGSNAWGKHYHKLSTEELFLMNLNDKEILAILNLSIYQCITQNDYSHLLNGVFTYSRLRLQNRIHISGNENWSVIESLITNDKELLNTIYPKSSPFNIDTTYDTVVRLSGNLLKTILGKSDFKNQSHRQYLELIGEVSSKFDNALLKYLYGLTTDDNELCKTSFEQMEHFYSRCRWLVSGWYREANLNKKIPIFLLGLYQLKNFATTNFDLFIKNEFLKNANRFIVENPNYEPKLFRKFDGELEFLNEILINNFASFYDNFQSKMNEIKK